MIRDESGVIAIIVALSISTFLLGFAALAVDLGTAYVRKAELKSVADKLALAGAQLLPLQGDAVDAVIRALGQDSGPGGNPTGLCADNDVAGLCDAPAGWATDGDPANGEITFYSDQGQAGDLADINRDGVVNTLDRLTDDTAQAFGIHVVLPPAKVPFGFASALGFNSASVQESATARIGTPLGSGILPFPLGQGDVSTGEFCVVDPSVADEEDPEPPATGFPYFPFLIAPFSSVDPAGQPITVTVGIAFSTIRPNSVVLHFWDGKEETRPPVSVGAGGQYTVTVPPGEAGQTIDMWATGRATRGRTFATGKWTLTYSGTPATKPDPCTLTSANRGFLKIARSSGGDTLEDNIRQGPEVKLYPSGGLIDTVGQLVGCVSGTLTSPSTTCLSNVLGTTFSRDLTDGLFDSGGATNGTTKPGRLDGKCGAGETDARGNNVDAMQLFADSSPLVNTSKGSADHLQRLVESGATVPDDDDRGWITSQALTCPRLAVMPVLDPNPISGVSGQKILKFEYVWIDDTDSGHRGLNFIGDQLQSFQGYVIDPKLLPAIVANSPVVGPYLGDSMPKEALLIPNFT